LSKICRNSKHGSELDYAGQNQGPTRHHATAPRTGVCGGRRGGAAAVERVDKTGDCSALRAARPICTGVAVAMSTALKQRTGTVM